MICFRSECLCGNKDAFLGVTIFVSVKTLRTLRTVCRAFHQWLSDPFNFAWKKRIQNAFPDTYSDVLKEKIDDQMRRLLVFDTLVEEGHSVSYFWVAAFPEIPKQQAYDTAERTKRLQLPWRKELFVVVVGEIASLFDSSSGSVVARLDLPNHPYKVLVNINGELMQIN
jgi:hypothetical protein